MTAARPPEPEAEPEPPAVHWATPEANLETVQRRFRWPRNYGPTGPQGRQYLVAALLLTTPTGRADLRHDGASLVEDGAIRHYVANMMLSLGECHSDLQEPHGSEPCASWHPRHRYGFSTDPHQDPLRLWNTLASEDGPRPGRGIIKLTIRLWHPVTGSVYEVSRTARECNMRRDLKPIINRIPLIFADRVTAG